jgi:hypothetical protein
MDDALVNRRDGLLEGEPSGETGLGEGNTGRLVRSLTTRSPELNK